MHHPSQAYKVPKKTPDQIIRMALGYRNALDLSVQEGLKADRFMDTLMGLFALEDKVGFEITEPSEMVEMGKYDPMNDLVRIRADVYDNAEKGCIESLYTITHEFGHMNLHAGAGFCRLERLSAEDIDSLSPDEHSEEQADLFACALHLHPERLVELLKQKQLISSISEMYKIPTYLLKRYASRLRECGYKIGIFETEQFEMNFL